jgi:phosphoribosyl 1,2-cyclic phosphodiesterase
MKVTIWGCRGSLPRAVTADEIRHKIKTVLAQAQQKQITSAEAIEPFLDTLPFALRGTYGTSTSCVEVRSGANCILLDAGTGLREAGLSIMQHHPGPQDIHILLSHLHWDHLQGFPFFVPAFIPGNRITIYGCHDEIERHLRMQQQSPYFPVSLDYMQAEKHFVQLTPGCTTFIAGMQVTPILQDHPGASYGYRICDGTSTMVYSTDSEHKADADAPDYPFIDFIRDADLLIFDAQYSLQESIQTKENWGHSSNMIGCELAIRAGVKHLALYHFDPGDDDTTLDDLGYQTTEYCRLMAPENPMKISVCYESAQFNL